MPNCKYIKQQEIVSYNGGVDWQDVMPAQYRKGQLIEHDSEDCGELDTIYRWRKLTGVYLCVDDVKYEKLILDESYDGGLSWYPAYPSQYTTGEEIGVDEDYCNDKFVGHYAMTVTSSGGGTIGHECPTRYYWNGYRCVMRPNTTQLDPIKIVKCDGNPELTSADTKYYTSYPSNYKFSLLSAEIGKCVTSIAASAFTNSSAMTYVSMADSVTTIGAHAFRGCTSLSGMNTTTPGVLNIPSGVRSIGTSAFNGCSGITSIICEQTTPPSLGNNVFANTNNCPIYVPCGSYGSYQYSWPSLVSRIAPIGGTVCDSVRVRYYYNGESSTYYCGNATKIQGADADGTGVERSAITGVSIGDCVTEIGYTALSGCGFTNIDIPSGVTSIAISAFTRCDNLASITIPSSVTSIGSGAFTRCSGLTSCTINGGSIGDSAFESCNNLTSCVIGNGVTSIGKRAFYSCSGLSSCTIGSGVTSIGGGAFRDCTSLTSIDIPNSVRGIGGDAFSGCTSLSSCTIGSGVTSIGSGAFKDCTSLTGNLEIPDSTTSIGTSAFTNSGGFTSISIGSGVTKIGDYAFYRMIHGSLTGITIYATTPPTIGDYPLYGTNNCPIYVPAASVTAYKAAWSNYASRIQPIPTKWIATYSDSSVTSAECDSTSEIVRYEIESNNLMSVLIGDCVTSIGERAFQGCRSLTSVNIPSGVTIINLSTFYRCDSLTSVTIPDGVTSIGQSAFAYCSGLTSCTIGSSVMYIAQSVFYGCSGLISVTVEATTPPTLGASVFDQTNDCPIYVPSGSVDAYKAASGWRGYASRIQAIT